MTRIYALMCLPVVVLIAFMSFTQPGPTRKPDEQHTIGTNVPKALPGPPPTARPVSNGEPLVNMQIPRFGEDWLWTALEGVDNDTLAIGPGHYPNTVLPGEAGNSAFAGHRSGHGEPFADFDKLQVGDEIILSQADVSWVYAVRKAPVVIESDTLSVLDNKDGVWLTLTTCWPRYGAEKRMYIQAELVETKS